MKQSISWTVMVALVLAACGERGGRGSGGSEDAGGGRDAGMVPERDSGSGAEDGGGPGPVDAGPAAVCSEPEPIGDCVLRVPRGAFESLTDACLPRCSAATGRAWRECTTFSCRNSVLAADTTPGVMYYIGTAPVSDPLLCGDCVAYMEMHCFSLVCPTEVDQYVEHCIAGVDPSLCDPSIDAIDRCLAALTATEEETVATCFDSVDGPAGCFACE